MTLDFQTNKRVCEEVAIIPSKGLKNKIAGYATVRRRAQPARRPHALQSVGTGAGRRGPALYALGLRPAAAWVCRIAFVARRVSPVPPPFRSQHLMKRIQRGPVRGISLKLQEEERERRMDFVPDVSAVDTDVIEVDAETKAMLRSLDMGNLQGLVVHSGQQQAWKESKPKRN